MKKECESCGKVIYADKSGIFVHICKSSPPIETSFKTKQVSSNGKMSDSKSEDEGSIPSACPEPFCAWTLWSPTKQEPDIHRTISCDYNFMCAMLACAGARELDGRNDWEIVELDCVPLKKEEK